MNELLRARGVQRDRSYFSLEHARLAIMPIRYRQNYATAGAEISFCPVDRLNIYSSIDGISKNRFHKTFGNNTVKLAGLSDQRETSLSSKLKPARVTQAIGNQSQKLCLI